MNKLNALPCPSQVVIKDKNIEELASTGQTKIEGKDFQLIPEKKTHNDYNGKLLDTKKHLEGFLKITQYAAARPSVTGGKARLVSLKTPPEYCAYNISVGETSGVIALEDVSKAVK